MKYVMVESGINWNEGTRNFTGPHSFKYLQEHLLTKTNPNDYDGKGYDKYSFYIKYRDESGIEGKEPEEHLYTGRYDKYCEPISLLAHIEEFMKWSVSNNGADEEHVTKFIEMLKEQLKL